MEADVDVHERVYLESSKGKDVSISFSIHKSVLNRMKLVYFS